VNKLLLLLLSVLFCGMLVSCTAEKNKTNTSAAPGEMTRKVIEELSLENLVEIKKDLLSTHYSIDASLLSDFSVYISDENDKPYEIAVFEVTDEKNVPMIQSAVADRINHKLSAFGNVQDGDKGILNQNTIETRGRYIFFAVTENYKKAQSVFFEFFE